MISIIAGSTLAILLIIGLFFYYAGVDKTSQTLKETETKSKVYSIFLRTKEQYIVISMAGFVMLMTFLISQYGYQADTLHTLKWQLAAGLIVPIAYIDKKDFIIPNKLLLCGLAFTVVIYVVQCSMEPVFIFSIIANAIVGCLVGGGIFFIASLIVKNGVGAGDIKLFLWLGFLLTFRGIFNVLLYSMVISAVSCVVLIICKKKTFKDELPLAPFAMAGILIAICFGV